MTRRMQGFSLIELLTVIAIMGILITLSFQGFSWLSASTKAKSASTELYLALTRARNEAVKRNRLVALVPNASGWQAGWQIIADTAPAGPPVGDGTFSTASGDRLIIDTGAQSRVTITSNITSVVFLTSGRIAGTLPKFTVTSLDKTTLKRCISADLTGKPYVKDPGAGTCP